MKRESNVQWHLFSVLKATEGGIGKTEALRRLKDAGIPCRPTTSALVGHTGVEVPSGYVKRTTKLLFG